MVCFLGIDPGVSGGIAVLNEDGTVIIAAKMPETDMDLWDLLRQYTPRVAGRSHAVLERVNPGVFGARGRAGAQMGVVSAFTFGKGYGRLLAFLTAAYIPFSEVSPAVWQKLMGCRTGGDKRISRLKAQQLFPSVKCTHYVSDSLLIAEFCRRCEQRTHGPLFVRDKTA